MMPGPSSGGCSAGRQSDAKAAGGVDQDLPLRAWAIARPELPFLSFLLGVRPGGDLAPRRTQGLVAHPQTPAPLQSLALWRPRPGALSSDLTWIPNVSFSP